MREKKPKVGRPKLAKGEAKETVLQGESRESGIPFSNQETTGSD
jgi:hypothetical protein